MSVWKDVTNPHWRTDALSEELRRANEKIQRLELEQQRLRERLARLTRSVAASLSGEGLP